MSRKTNAQLELEIVYLTQQNRSLQGDVDALKMKLNIFGEVNRLGMGINTIVIALERSTESTTKALEVSNQQMLYLLNRAGIKFPKE